MNHNQLLDVLPEDSTVETCDQTPDLGAAPDANTPIPPANERVVQHEMETLPDLFASLAARRAALRQQIHPWACKPTAETPNADRADQVLSLFQTIVLRIGLPEVPENWTLRDKPEILRQTLVMLLRDMKQLAHTDKLDWDEVLAQAEQAYQDDMANDCQEYL
jgi:hypothetical protein